MATTDDRPDQHDLTVAPIVGPDDPRRFTDSGIEIEPLYTEARPARRARPRRAGRVPLHARRAPRDVPQADVDDAPVRGLRLGEGVQRALPLPALEGLAPGLSMAFDLPTQLGLDSDNPRCLGEVGRTGVAIDTIDDMRTAFDGIPLDQVSTSMTINAPAAVPAAALRAGRRGAGRAQRAAARHDAERRAQGVHRARQLHLPARADDAADDRPVPVLPRERPAAGTRSRSPATTSARRAARPCRRSRSRCPRASPTCRRRSTQGLDVDDFAPRLAFFFNGHNNVFQEVAKFRAARRMWAHIMRERFGAKNPKSTMLRFHTQTGGVTLTAQQPENNIVRVALQGFAAVCGGTQSLHTNGFDEALALPTERAAKIALRTQQILAHESGAADTVDPFAGSYFVESLTDEIEARAQRADREGRRARRLGQRDRVHHRRDRRVGLGLPGALPHRPGHRGRRQQVRGGRHRGARPAARRPRVRARTARPPEGVQGRPRPGARRAAPGGAARGGARRATTCCPRSARR